MTPHPVTLADLAAAERSWDAGEEPLLVVDLDSPGPVRPLRHQPFVVVGVTADASADQHPARGRCDVILSLSDGSRLEAIAATVAVNPLAATALALVLRGSEERSLDDGLLVESATYSALQGGPELAAWLAARPRRDRPVEGDAVVLERAGERLEVTLDRPHVRNALNTTMRDQLVEAFRLVALDDSISEVHLRGAGQSFCAGGDLDEFGSFPDPAVAHLVRLQQSAGRAIAAVADRTTAHLHGSCAGSGIELPAFAGTVVARRDTRITLPEVALGLIPGAGGTVSLPRRIGRHRTARLALTGEAIDAHTAMAWGLVDAIEG